MFVGGVVEIAKIIYERNSLVLVACSDIEDAALGFFQRRLFFSLGGWRHSTAVLSCRVTCNRVRCMVDEAEALWLLRRHSQIEGNSAAADLIADNAMLEDSQRAKKPTRKRTQNITTLRRWAFLCAVELRKKEPGYIVIGDAAGKEAFRNGVPERTDIEYL